MEKLKVILLFIVSAFGIDLLNAQIEWLEKDYNYGAIKEVDGPQKGSVRFVNKGGEPVFVNNVRSSCGCTNVEYPKGMIAPGDTASISFVYNPKGRPGAFEKTVKAYMGAENDLYVIRLSGTVIGSPSTLSFSYPYEVGPMRLESLKAVAGELKEGSSRHMFINAYNQSGDTITPSWNCGDKALQIELTPRSIPPGQVATFGFYLRTTEEERMGPVEYEVDILADYDNPELGECVVTASAVIVPDTRKMSVEEVENGPRAYLSPEFIDLGESDKKGKRAFSFEILNEGKSILEVKRIYSTDSGIEIKGKPSKVKPGGKGKVKGVIDMGKLPVAPFRIAVEVMTNDALHPVRIANLVGEVSK